MMQPPGRIEQLNNFQDSMQSPDGLDRLRAMQYVQASSQGLSGMPQVTAPVPQMQPQVPMINKAYGGEIGTGGLLKVAEDGTQIFDNSQEGALNRAVYGGVLEGYNYTPSTGGTATAASTPVTTNSLDAPGTLAAGGVNTSYGSTLPKSAIEGTDLYNMPHAQSLGGVYSVSDVIDSGTSLTRPSNAPETIPARDRPQTTLRDPETGKIPWGAYVPQDIVSFGQGYDLKDIDYFTANAIALKDGAERFIYNNEYARTDPGLLSNYDYGRLGTKPYRPLENLQKIQNMTTGMYSGGIQGTGPQAQSMTSAPVMRAKGYVQGGRPSGGADHPSNTWSYKGINPEARKYLGMGVYADYKHGGQITARAYGGEIGTGGLVGIAEDGTQIFNNSQEGALNRATHGGVLEGYNYTPSTGGTATATATTPSSTPITTNSLDAPGTLAAGGANSSYGNTLPKSAIADTDLGNMTSVQERGGIYNASDVVDSGMSLIRPTDAPETIVESAAQTPYRDPYSGQIPFDLYVNQPVNTFGQGYDLKNVDYFTANALAAKEGAQRFMYNNEYAAVDPGLLSNYDYSNLGTKPYSAPTILPGVSYSGVGGVGHSGSYANAVQNPNSSAAMAAMGYSPTYSGHYTYTGIKPYIPHIGRSEGGQITARAEGGQVDPAQAAQGLASFGRYGDNILVHMNPEELDGLASLGEITYNPVTGLPEAFSLKGLFKGIRKIAPIALAIAAPYAAAAWAPALFGTTAAAGIGGMSALSFGAATGIGSFLGNKIAGAKTSDALKAGLMSGAMGGIGKGLSSGNWIGSGGQTGNAALTSGRAALDSGQQILQASNAVPQATNVATNAAKSMSQFGGNLSGASNASLAGSQSNLIQNATNPYSYSSSSIPQQYSGSVGNANQIGLANANVAPVINTGGSEFANQISTTPASLNPEITGTSLANTAPSTPTGFVDTAKQIGSDIYKDYANPKGIAKLVAMDLSTPDWEAQYAAEAAAKNQQLTDAGYTVETGFDGQTVIRDSTGVVMPRNLTVQDILDRALGKQKRTNLVARTDYAPKESKQGGLISLKHGGEFSGMVPGDGHGMEDNVYMPIVEKGHGSQVGTLAVSPSEYVVDSYTMAALGNGNADAGAKVMDNVVKNVRKKAYGNTKQPNEISGLKALQPMTERV